MNPRSNSSQLRGIAVTSPDFVCIKSQRRATALLLNQKQQHMLGKRQLLLTDADAEAAS